MTVLACVLAAVAAGFLAFVGIPRRRSAAGWKQRQRARIMCPWCLEKVRLKARVCEHCRRPVNQPSLSASRR